MSQFSLSSAVLPPAFFEHLWKVLVIQQRRVRIHQLREKTPVLVLGVPIGRGNIRQSRVRSRVCGGIAGC